MATRLVVGLGNPGPEYAGTRHNVGFEVLERLVLHEGELFRKAAELEGYRGPRSFAWARTSDPDALLVKPLTWMNRSGDVVAPLARFALARPEDSVPAGPRAEESHGAPPEIDPGPGIDPESGAPPDATRLLVVYDDMDLDVGVLRIRPHGGSGGHNGMRSIIEHLGTDRFPRVRVGIGRPGPAAARHVLSPFSEKERVEIDVSVVEAGEAILDWLHHGDIEKCMTRFHSRWNQDS